MAIEGKKHFFCTRKLIPVDFGQFEFFQLLGNEAEGHAFSLKIDFLLQRESPTAHFGLVGHFGLGAKKNH